MTEDERPRRLIRTTLKDRASDGDEEVEDESERGETGDNGCDGDADIPKVPRKGTAEKKKRNLQHQRQRLHYMVKVPSDDAVKLSLSVVTAFFRRPSHVCRLIAIQPLLAKHRQEGGEEGNGETCKENRLDMNYRGGRPGPSREGGNITSKGGAVDLVNKDAEEGGGLVARVRL